MLRCFASSLTNCWDEKIFFLALKPLRSTLLEKPLPAGLEFGLGFAIAPSAAARSPPRSLLAGDAVHSDSRDKLRDYEIFPAALMQLEGPARGR